MKRTHVEVLSIAGCPATPDALRITEKAVKHLIPGTEVKHTIVENEGQAEQLHFPGSPTIRVNGEDIERLEAGRPRFSPRHYGGSEGVPPAWMIEAAILRSRNPKHILFLCVANSVRSQMAEGIARSLAPPGVKISSAGSTPLYVNENAILVLEEIGVDISGQRSKSVGEFSGSDVEAVITLCADEVCPLFLDKALRAHWGLPDPTFTHTGGEDRLEPFRVIRDELRHRLAHLFR